MTITRVSEDSVPGPHGPVPVRVYEPVQPEGTGLVWLHGGAFYQGDLDVPEADWVSRRLAEAGITVVSVDYRLALDGVHFPVPGDDVLAAWTWATGEHRLGVAPENWHLGGGSAGGNLAASVAMQARDGRGRLPRSSVLVYPVLHDQVPPASAELRAKVARLPQDEQFSPEASRELNLNYVGQEDLLTHPYAFPANGVLDGLPPTLIVNSDHDGLRASGEAYAAALALAGVDVTVVREVGVGHGHLNETSAPGARRTVRRISAWLTRPDLIGEAHEPPVDGAPTSAGVTDPQSAARGGEPAAPTSVR
ncbi:alpha/beta hydrolase [Myceligenerans indicum]|uniref:Alpha/beta hydrolase n=1 Tax=Myceligenerans indicum TaxID=2593663 RepID=A0ABS1LLT8_9MICO|nr:alpha/beta hydrolase [Myceligenerans indicum]MBL0887138.1 alpha/beta hydrolase [Myceligenerans indicum]